MTEQSREPVLWGGYDDEQYSHDNMNAYIEDTLDATYPDPLPETLEVVGYVPEVVGERDRRWMADRALDCLTEWLHEDYGHPEESADAVTPSMEAAARTFVDAVVSEFVVWRCEPVARKTINVREWIREHRPDWHEPVTIDGT